MKRSRIRKLIKEFLKENQSTSTLGGYVVYASSSSEGMFEELVVLKKTNIIDDSESTEDGTFICRYKHQGKEEEFFYVDKVE